jgi:hypothetical protein
MGIPQQPGRPKSFLLLAGFVVVFGMAAWVVTGGAGTRVVPLSHNHPPPRASGAFTPGPPTPPACKSDQLQLVGSFNDCASIDSASSNCKVSPPAFNTLFKLLGPSQDFLLYLIVPDGYSGAGEYSLDTGAAEVDVREYPTGALWQSVAGILTVTGSDGRSGTVSATLETSPGNDSVVPAASLTVNGPWICR